MTSRPLHMPAALHFGKLSIPAETSKGSQLDLAATPHPDWDSETAGSGNRARLKANHMCLPVVAVGAGQYQQVKEAGKKTFDDRVSGLLKSTA